MLLATVVPDEFEDEEDDGVVVRPKLFLPEAALLWLNVVVALPA